jgi:hypothetical protein
MRYPSFVWITAAAIAAAAMPASPAFEPVPGDNDPRQPLSEPGSDASPGTRSLQDMLSPWLQAGGDGGSPWPTVLIPPQQQNPCSAGLGDARLYAHTHWDGSDLEIRLVRLGADGGSRVFALTSDGHDDVLPQLSALPQGPPLVVWRRRVGGGFDLLATLVAPDGTPAGSPVRLGRFGPDVVDATAVLLPDGVPLVAIARRDVRETVIEASAGGAAPIPVGTAPPGAEVALRVSVDEEGAPRIVWSRGGDTTASVDGDARGRWSAPRYERRLRR